MHGTANCWTIAIMHCHWDAQISIDRTVYTGLRIITLWLYQLNKLLHFTASPGFAQTDSVCLVLFYHGFYGSGLGLGTTSACLQFLGHGGLCSRISFVFLSTSIISWMSPLSSWFGTSGFTGLYQVYTSVHWCTPVWSHAQPCTPMKSRANLGVPHGPSDYAIV